MLIGCECWPGAMLKYVSSLHKTVCWVACKTSTSFLTATVLTICRGTDGAVEISATRVLSSTEEGFSNAVAPRNPVIWGLLRGRFMRSPHDSAARNDGTSKYNSKTCCVGPSCVDECQRLAVGRSGKQIRSDSEQCNRQFNRLLNP